MDVYFKPHWFSCHYAEPTALAALGDPWAGVGCDSFPNTAQPPPHSSLGHHPPALPSQNTVSDGCVLTWHKLRNRCETYTSTSNTERYRPDGDEGKVKINMSVWGQSLHVNFKPPFA